MLGHIGGGAAVLAAQCQALQHAQRDQDDRRGHADAGVVGQDADDEGRQAHDQDGHQEGVLAPDHVAQAAEHQRAEGPHDEACRKGQQREDEGRSCIQTAEELLGDDGRQRTVQIEVVPLENGAERRGKDDLALFRAHRPWGRFTSICAVALMAMFVSGFGMSGAANYLFVQYQSDN
jgi:hypothetical protein